MTNATVRFVVWFLAIVSAHFPLGLAADDTNFTAKEAGVDSLGDPLPKGALLRLGTRRFHHPSSVIELALSPDEQTVVTIGSQELIAWDAATGKMRWREEVQKHGIRLPGAAYGVRALAFASDSSRFYTPGRENEVIAWSIATGKREVITMSDAAPLDGLAPAVSRQLGGPKAIAVTSDGKRFALGGSQGVIVCDEKGKILYELSNKRVGPIPSAVMNKDRLWFGGNYSYGVFSHDQKVLAVATSDSPDELLLHSADSGKLDRRIKLKAPLVRFAFSPNSQQIVTTERDIAVRLYAADSGQEIWSFVITPTNSAESYTSAVAYLPDARTIAACAPIGSEYEIRLLNAADGKEIGKLVGHTWKPWCLAATAKSDTLYSSGWDGAVRRWDIAKRQQLPLPKGVRGTGVVAASPDGQKLAYSDDSGTIHVVQSNEGAELFTIELEGTAYSDLTFSPDSLYLAGGGTVGDQVHVAVWDLRNRKLVHRWDWPKGKDPHSSVECICFRPDGKQLAAAVFRQSAVTMWDLTTGGQLAKLEHSNVYGLSFSPDSETLATAGWDKIVRFWKSNNGELQRAVNVSEGREEGADHRMYTVCYSHAGDLLATAHLDGNVRIWDAADMSFRKQFQVRGRFVYGSICFSPDGSLLAAGSMGGQIALWDPYTAEVMWEVGQHENYVYRVAFGADHRTLVSGGNDGVCYRWDLKPSKLPTNEELDLLWRDLAGDGEAAYWAMWAMAQTPDRTVTFLGDKLRPVNRVMDLDRIVKGLPPDEAERRERLTRVLVKKDGRIALTVVARRAISTLAQIQTDDAIRLLKELAERDANSELAKLAATAVARLAK